MDTNIVYAKTPAGEEAMRQRTRVVQRNMRMVLILIDGKSSVADLTEKVGNSDLVESALRDLEEGGFIAPLLEADSLWEESRKVADMIRAAAMNRISNFSAFDNKPLPGGAGATNPESEGVSPPSPSPSQPGASASVSDFSKVPVQGDMSIFAGEESIFAPPLGARPVPSPVPPVVAPHRGGWRTLFRNKAGAEATMPEDLAPIRSRPRLFASRLMGVLVSFGFLLVLAALLLLFYPYERHRDTWQELLSRSLATPVQIGGMQVVFRPMPRIMLADVRIGAGEEIRMEALNLLPNPLTLFSERKELPLVELEQLALTPQASALIPALLERMVREDSPLRLDRVLVNKAAVGFAGLAVQNLSGELERAPDGRFSQLRLHDADRTLNIELRLATGGGIQFNVEGIAWRPGGSSAWLIDTLSASGLMAPGSLVMEKLEARLLGGAISGRLAFIQERKAGLSAVLVYDRIGGRALTAALNSPPFLTGEFAGKVRLEAVAEDWLAIPAALTGNGEFSSTRGSLEGLDLAEAVRRGGRSAVAGGATRFEQINGYFGLGAQGVDLRINELASGLMRSSGDLTIQHNRKVSGHIEVVMQGSVGQLRAPVTVSGAIGQISAQAGK